MSTSKGLLGLHHVTAIASGAQANLDFYTTVLGLRLVKRTVNFDAPDTHHFYYGDAAGSPGSLLTFFPFADAAAGRVGTGMVQTTALAIPEAAFDAWVSRLAAEARDFDGPFTRFGEPVLGLRDPDGLRIELVAEAGLVGDEASGAAEPKAQAIRRLHSVTLCVEAPERTARLLTAILGYVAVGEEAGRRRFRAPGGGPAANLDLLCQPESMPGRMGAGSVHHVAFRVRDDAELLAWREALLASGFDVTPVQDRQYAHAIYFREPGGVRFEIATDRPGIAVDEAPDALGSTLRLPSWLEARRADIERRLQPIRLPRRHPG